jgi:class 3 adenylate cyclase
VEEFDLTTALTTIESASWRHGPHRPLSTGTLLSCLALVSAGDLLDRPGLTKAGREQLRLAYEQGCMVAPDWPVLIPRLLAGAARQEGDLGTAERYLAHAERLAERETLAAEAALAGFERARLDHARGEPGAAVAAALTSARRRCDELGMRGWGARTTATAERWGLDEHLAPAVARARTILTTDVVASTATNARLGDVLYVEQLRVHDRVCRARVREFHGTEIKHTGDGLNVVFDDAGRAVACALAMQADLRAWAVAEPDLALAIRCGLALGDLVHYDGDLFGLTQSEAARLCALAGPGEVLLSAAVRAAVSDAGLAIEDLGERALRGLPGGARIYRLATIPYQDGAERDLQA